jgi:hydroxysqualene dehydroxylase
LANSKSSRRVAVIGAGWAGLAAAIRAVQAGHHVTVFEAARSLGGRARGVALTLPSGERFVVDNGQHVLLGAYRETLALMALVGIDLDACLTRLSVQLGLFQTAPWSLGDYASLMRCAVRWCWQGFTCPKGTVVADLYQTASKRVIADLLEPLCLSALNTAPAQASGEVFLRVLKDSFLGKAYVYSGGNSGGKYKSADMLIPKVDLSTLFPDRAALWLQDKGAVVRLGVRVASLAAFNNQWTVNDRAGTHEFDQVVLATPPFEAARLVRGMAPDWVSSVDAMDYRAIATVYAQAPRGFVLPKPMLALTSNAVKPAQFVFSRAEANPSTKGLLAFVVSDAQLDRAALERLVLAQGEAALGVVLQPVTTILERRATFACTATMTRPAQLALAGLSVVGDYVQGPYPATIEGAVLSAIQIKSD